MNNHKNEKNSKLYKEGRVLIKMVSTSENKVPKKADGKESWVGQETANALVKAKRAKLVK